jgi:fermentation-respiration switch protein FrsA (DUF1100 family)
MGMTNRPAHPHPWRRRLWRWAVLLCCGYVGVLLVLLAFENSLLFHPARYEESWQEAPPAARAEDVYLETADGTRIHGWWCPTSNWEPSHGAVLYLHGNAGNLSHRGESVVRWQQRLHLPVLIIDYPGYGRSDGKPSEADCYAAANAAFAWLAEQKDIPGERIILYGGSLGGAVAIDLASRQPCRALVLVSAFTSVPDMAQQQYPWLPARWLVRNRFESEAKIGRCACPIFLAHGTADHLVPFTMGERLFVAAREPKQFFAMEGHDHKNTPPPAFYDAVREFLARNEESRAH